MTIPSQNRQPISANIAIVQRLYDMFATRDFSGIAGVFHPEIEWIQMPGFPGGGTFGGTDAVLQGVFNRLHDDWSGWKAITEDMLDAGSSVLVSGRYTGRFRATGAAIDAPFMHHYTIEGGRIRRFRQYTDTRHIADAMVAEGDPSAASKAVVQAFLDEVRSGRAPELASRYMADTVLAHQLHAEQPVTLMRTPDEYAAHVREFQALFGAFEFELREIIAEGDRVYVRWEQRGRHQAAIDGYAPTGEPLVEFTSVVYRVRNGKIAEYWLQTDRKGLDLQLQRLSQR